MPDDLPSDTSWLSGLAGSGYADVCLVRISHPGHLALTQSVQCVLALRGAASEFTGGIVLIVNDSAGEALVDTHDVIAGSRATSSTDLTRPRPHLCLAEPLVLSRLMQCIARVHGILPNSWMSWLAGTRLGKIRALVCAATAELLASRHASAIAICEELLSHWHDIEWSLLCGHGGSTHRRATEISTLPLPITPEDARSLLHRASEVLQCLGMGAD
jgi:hypothetical protein